MSAALDRLAQARALAPTEPARADRLAAEAIQLDADLGAAYALRGRLAAQRGDPVVAAHYFRVAFARGDRSADTRLGLSLCLEASGQAALAARVREDTPLVAPYADFADVAAAQGPAIRQMLAAPLPPKGTPAWLPGERPPPTPGRTVGLPPPPVPDRTPPPQVSAAPAAAPPRAESPPPAALPPPGDLPPPADLPPPVGATAPRPSRRAAPTSGRVVRRGGQVDAPDWLEVHHVEVDVDAEREDWAVSTAEQMDAMNPSEGLRIDAGAPLQLVVDPGLPQAPIRSPITGQMIDGHDLVRQYDGAQMPGLVRHDPLEARAELLRDVADPEDLRVAVHLPGPVMTAPGHRPRKLCQQVALGVTATEVILRDVQDAAAIPARLPFVTIATLEVVNEGAQLTFGFADGRQIHLDLRGLRQRSVVSAAAVLDAITRRLEG